MIFFYRYTYMLERIYGFTCFTTDKGGEEGEEIRGGGRGGGGGGGGCEQIYQALSWERRRKPLKRSRCPATTARYSCLRWRPPWSEPGSLPCCQRGSALAWGWPPRHCGLRQVDTGGGQGEGRQVKVICSRDHRWGAEWGSSWGWGGKRWEA